MLKIAILIADFVRMGVRTYAPEYLQLYPQLYPQPHFSNETYTFLPLPNPSI